MRRLIIAILCWTGASLAWAQGPMDDATLVQRRNEIREVAYESLVALYELSPGANLVVERAAGYAVFSAFGTKRYFADGATGKGIVVNNATKRQTFMNMAQGPAGTSGARRDRLIFVFETQQALSDFVKQGRDFGGQAGAVALPANRGGLMNGAVSVSPGVYLYQLTEQGIAASIALGGTRFSVDPDLN